MANESTSKAETHAAEHGPGRYFVVWLLLLIFTVTTVVTGRMDLGGANLPLALAIATIKATLVVLFFMHLSEAAGANRVIFVASLLFMIVLMLGVFGDLLTRSVMTLPSDAPRLLDPEGAMPGESPPVQHER